jgi:hypothetical protein
MNLEDWAGNLQKAGFLDRKTLVPPGKIPAGAFA